jgi:hypothetical protein
VHETFEANPPLPPAAKGLTGIRGSWKGERLPSGLGVMNGVGFIGDEVVDYLIDGAPIVKVCYEESKVFDSLAIY